jgi:pimeloyl-ACP methyl ester carboxylesterase
MIIERDGATVHYEVTGKGTPIVLGHSLLCDTAMWRGVAPRLAERHRVINVEARAHGRSSASRAFTLDDLAADWLAILDQEQIDRAWLCGLSMGGMTAMRIALRAPGRVAGMVLIDSNAGREERRKRAQYAVMGAIYRRFGMPKPLIARTAQIMIGRTSRANQPQLVDELRDVAGRHDRAQFPFALRAVFGRGDLLPRLSQIYCPTLVLVGDEDRATPVDKSRQIAAGIPGARLEIVNGVGHLSALEDPDAIATKVLAFVGAHHT